MLLDLLSQNDIPILAVFIFAIGALLSISLHEYSHALSADLLGDKTPRYQGRVTLNPLAHLDPLGTFMMFFAFFGWGKPVEVNPQNMGMYPERKYFISSIVGPITNILIAAIVFGVMWLYAILTNMTIFTASGDVVFRSLQLLFMLNVVLAVFNAIPITPLDGSKIWGVILPYGWRMKVEPFLDQYSIYILILLVLPIIPASGHTVSLISFVINPIVSFVNDVIVNVIF